MFTVLTGCWYSERAVTGRYQRVRESVAPAHTRRIPWTNFENYGGGIFRARFPGGAHRISWPSWRPGRWPRLVFKVSFTVAALPLLIALLGVPAITVITACSSAAAY